MPRGPRLDVAGALYHVIARGVERRAVFRDDRDRLDFLRRVAALSGDMDITVFAFNHVHLLVQDRGGDEIARSLQLISGCTGQAYNRRKQRLGAFWQDRYHATAVEGGEHLARCVVCVDLNMVRAGVVAHPREWAAGGYHEIQGERQRYRIVDRAALAAALGVGVERLAEVHRAWIEDALRRPVTREPKWSEGVAVGGRPFAERVLRDLGRRARDRRVEPCDGGYVVREPPGAYGAHVALENAR